MENIVYKKFCGLDPFDGSLEHQDRVMAFEVNIRIKKFIFYRWVVPRIEKEHPISEVVKIIESELKRCIDICQGKKDKIFNEYLEMSQSGKDFKERKEWLELKEKELTIIGWMQADFVETLGSADPFEESLEVIPYKDWLKPGDEKIISKGFEEFIKFYGFNLQQAYVRKKGKEVKGYKFNEK